MTEAIVINQLTKQYKQKTAVNNVQLSIHEGELFGLLGVNGAGKTTLIHMLCGLIAPTSGNATILGYDMKRQRERIQPHIAVAPQELAIAPNLTVEENLMLMANIYGFSKTDAAQRVQRVMTQLSLTPFVKQRAKTLSGGWQRRLSIAMALLTSPKILFLDEPTLGLDILGRRELWHMIEQLKHHTTIILTTHYLEEAEALCDRICVMKDGDMKALGTTAELCDMTQTTSFEEAFISLVTEVSS
ncbi:ABC transporter ATP-binding protein [Kurthia massiliensis]|uniref:ABC transporter ATP-binding protein n=1 Tax=Kurthia massiliensis TaxID=1033739 RepID=UPI000289CE89|nr:ABC transporter ATP-binding protein [Kurthia massiliensis]